MTGPVPKARDELAAIYRPTDCVPTFIIGLRTRSDTTGESMLHAPCTCSMQWGLGRYCYCGRTLYIECVQARVQGNSLLHTGHLSGPC